MTKQKINWRHHFVELLVVIIGISIAFALDGWSERKKDDQLSVNYLRSLRSDLLKDKEDLLAVIDSSNVLMGHISETFQLTYSQARIESFKRHHITSAYTAPYFYPNNGSYESLVNSGNLNLLGDFELKTSLADLYNVRYKEIERVDGVIRTLVDDMIYPYMIKNIRFAYDRDGIVSNAPLKTNEATNLLGSYLNFLLRRRQSYSEIIADFDGLVNKIDQTIMSLE